MKNTAFTLIEILIVVILLGILAAIVIPMFTDSSEEAKISAEATDLQTLQGQVQLYRAKEGDYPGTLNDLAPKYLPSIPAPATGGDWGYTANTGVVTAP